MRSDRRGRWRYGASYAYVLAGVCALAMGPAVGHAQMNVEPGTANDQPATQAERAERARQADRAKAADVAPPDRVRYQANIIVQANSMSPALAATHSVDPPSRMLR